MRAPMIFAPARVAAAAAGLTMAGLALAGFLSAAGATPVISTDAVLPAGTELNEDLLDQPTELFEFEKAGGKRSYLFNLGDMLFSSPAIFGGKARDAGVSCNTCHQQGSNNAKLYVPGLSRRPGTFDTTGALFNPKADNGVLDPVTIPSLRGAKYLAPYTHDGHFGTLRDFIRNAIVNEFAGAEPTGQVLDALELYVREISFLPNRKLGPGGRLTAQASEAAHRGEAVFNRPFRNASSKSCAGCHEPDAAFVDHKLHDIGSGGLFKTKTLVNAKFNAPYFHDGRFDTFDEVVAYFDRHFDLGLTDSDRADLVAYLDAVGDADMPLTRNTVTAEVEELSQFVSVLDTAIPARDGLVVSLAVDSVGAEWRELGEKFPGRTDTSVSAGLAERLRARAAVRNVVLSLRSVAMAAAAGDYDAAGEAYRTFRQEAADAVTVLAAAERFSLFDPGVHHAHFSALRELTALTGAR